MLWILLLFLAPQGGQSEISGKVVLSDDNVPLVNEPVGLWPSGIVVRTGADGSYLFRGLPPDNYTLVVIHDHIKAGASVRLGPRQKMEGVLIVVNPAPAITGTVFDPFGHRLASARVDTFRIAYRPTGAHLRLVKSAMSDDQGDFRLFRLPPGGYYVSASYSERDQKSGGVSYRWSPNVSNADAGFPTLYFGGAYNATQSARIDLGQIDNPKTNVYYKEGPRYSVSGRLIGPDGGCGRIAIVQEGAVVDPEKDFTTNACGPFTVKGLSPGVHFLFAVAKGFASDAIRINIPDRNVEGAAVTLERTVTVRGRVEIDSPPAPASAPAQSRTQPLVGGGRGTINPGARGTTNSTSLISRRIVLWRASNEITQKIEQVMDPDGRFEIPEVGPGFFDVYVEPLTGGLFVASIRHGIHDLLPRPTELAKNVRENAGDLNIQLSGRSARVEGVALDMAGKPVPDTHIVLVPETLRNREDRYYSVYTDPIGNFSITGIAPGSYLVYAFEDLDTGAYFAMTYDEGIGNRWLPRGRRLTLSDAQASDPVKLLIIPATETIGGVLR
jgi:hypothetical protein